MKAFNAKTLRSALVLAAICAPIFFSCKTAGFARPCPEEDIPVEIMGSGKISAEGLASFFLAENPLASTEQVSRIASIYMEECAFEGVNSDIAFAQMCLETGFLRFGGLITEDMNNFCGLGAVSPEEPGHSFLDERTGIRAHVQHLKGYGTHEPLNGELVDPRFELISPKGKAPDIFALAGAWAIDPEYGAKIFSILCRMYAAALA